MDVMELDAERLEAFGERMVGILNSGMAANMISIGHQVGLFDTMAGMEGHSSPQQIADAAGLQERYVREWLGAMFTAGIVDYDREGGFRLPPEHAAMTTRAAGPGNFAAHTQMITMCAGVEQELIDKFRNGGGVPYSSFDRFHEAMREVSGAVFDATLVDVTLPLVPGLIEQLEEGISVADVGCGSGRAVNVMARAFPNSTFTGIDFSAEALATARAESADWGLSNTDFLEADAGKLTGEHQFDFITTFDAVHDQADPESMVAGIFASLRPGATWLCVDIQAATEVGDNAEHPLGTFFYSVSCQHCMTVSLAADGEGLGAMWGEERAREMFEAAGFTDIDVHTVEGDVANNYYVCRRP